ncbi:pullulanase-type alpha-1,6-glucosidase [Myxococcaceae bacterium JPH2]|nr:pullulanase-type alpha-1,6-glucosidase [Myxococcaceae bacterium JPH2]
MARALALGALVAAPLLPTATWAADPTRVTLVGDLQTELGCAADRDASCAATDLTYDASDAVWQGTFTVPAGTWHFQVALDGSLSQTRGGPGGTDVVLTQPVSGPVKFYFDNQTQYVASNRSQVVAVAAGSLQKALGCPDDWKPDCLRTLLQDPDGDGLYTLTTRALPVGAYQVKVALDESWTVNYGANGVPNGSNIGFTVSAPNKEAVFTWNATTKKLRVKVEGEPVGDLRMARAHWISRDTLVWEPEQLKDGATVRLHFDPAGAMHIAGTGIVGGDALTLTRSTSGLSAEQQARFPQLAGRPVFKLAAADVARVPELLKDQVALSATDPDGRPADATGLQLAGVLDDVDVYTGPLGVSFERGRPTLRVWAPTARAVSVRVFEDARPDSSYVSVPMTEGAKGVWSVTGEPSWYGRFYLYEVRVYVPREGAEFINLVTDPYSVALSTNSTRSQIVNLATSEFQPRGWNQLAKPALAAPEDIVLYELHARDFSIHDLTVPAEERGTFKAFTRDSDGMRHLSRLARAGVTHVHLLPVFDFATVNEDAAARREPEGDLVSMPPDSAEQQARVAAVVDEDGFNWGYDPLHYTVPEGSYSTNPNGPARTLEFRQMVQSLNQHGLRVVMDVVYNHTHSAGQDARSVLDRIVPGYYHRLNDDGNVETSTCCQNTASENAMFEKLMVDSVVTWAREYKVDGFRFDLMGHHMKSTMLRLRAALDALTPEKDGVDGKSIYVYGEGWDFGEVQNNQRGVNATQRNMAGTGIGTFSDRLRDAARGGSPFSGIQDQGFITGLSLWSNGTAQGTPAEQRARLLHGTDLIRLGLAGNLKDFSIVDSTGKDVTGAQVDYNGNPAGYAQDPQEVITYVSAHDNETLFDAVQLKAPREATLADRVRMHNLGISLVALSQGIPFFHAGDELLRSKSLDRNSYNSGDWFNQLDWTYQRNNWGVGLPRGQENQEHWPLFRTLLADPALKPSPADIQRALEHFEEMVRIRKSSPLFRLRTGEAVQRQVRFENTGPGQVPGLIVMSISGEGTDTPDARAVVFFNSGVTQQTFQSERYRDLALVLHPVQKDSTDPFVRAATFDAPSGTFTIPARTTAVFLSPPPGSIPPDGEDGCSATGGSASALIALGLLAGTALRTRRRRT